MKHTGTKDAHRLNWRDRLWGWTAAPERSPVDRIQTDLTTDASFLDRLCDDLTTIEGEDVVVDGGIRRIR